MLDMKDTELKKLKIRFDDVSQGSTTPEIFELCRAGSHLVDEIRARALRWTTEPPNVAGWYWYRCINLPSLSYCIEAYGSGDYLMFGSKRDDLHPQMPVTIEGFEWAGPIPAPLD